MENICNDLEIEEKLLNNSRLFSSIRKNKTPEDKIKKIKKYLDRGADINATDANDKNNTPLHVAVMKVEPEVVRFLLNQGAHVDIKNSDNNTASNIARLLRKLTRTREDIITMLMPFDENKTAKAAGQQGHFMKKGLIKRNSKSVPILNQVKGKSTHQQLDKTIKNIDVNKIFLYQKRKGTSSLSGQLYESKLLTLILFRALYVHKIQHFLLATNVENMGAFDDIVFRFLSSEGDKPKIMFIQAKHRENPAKDKFTVDEILKLNGDFNLHKYLESYIKISQMFAHENCDELFRGEFKNMDCEFIIYTSAIENFSKMKAVNQTEGKCFINTSEGKVFQFDYDDEDIKCLRQTLAKSRDFGNWNYCFSDTEEKLEYICLKFQQLFANAKITENIVMEVDDSMIGPNKILQSSDLEILRGLVGNLLVHDDETKTLKFNPDVNSLFDHNLKLFARLKSKVFTGLDVSKCRFNFNILSLLLDKNDRSFIELFLNRLIFYTNQAKEDEVEKILKKEIDKYFVGSMLSQNDKLFRVKSDEIFLKTHDRIQKWWKQPVNASYLTESCEYFFEAEQKFIEEPPLLSTLNYTYIKTIENALTAIKFKNTALKLFNKGFSTGSAKILSIITAENSLSSIKLIQYLKEQNINDYTFIDLDYVESGNYFANVKSDLKESKINTLIVVCKNLDLVEDIRYLIKHCHGKIIIIGDWQLADLIKKFSTENVVEIIDKQTGFADLADATRTMLLKDRFIVFQGEKIPLRILFQDKSYHLINSNLLYNIIINNNIAIGKCFNNPAFDEMSDVSINTSVCRYVTFDPNDLKCDCINILKYEELEVDFLPDTRDIVLIAYRLEEFEEFIKKYEKSNVHWFTADKEILIWQKSRGNLRNIFKHVERRCSTMYCWKPVTLKDMGEKVVIISAESGMGKSFLLTTLAINTKQKCPKLWISKINLLENTKELKRLKEQKVNIDLKETVHFLFRVIGLEANKGKNTDFETMIDEVSVVGDNIRFNKDIGEMNLKESNRFEIELFVHCYNNDRVVLLFDGYNEICPDFTNEFLQLVNILKMSKVVHLWITSRLYNVLHQLENTLSTFSFIIKPLDRQEEYDFLTKLLVKRFGSIILPMSNSIWYSNCVRALQKQIYTALNKYCKHKNDFLRAPLHMYIMLEIFQDNSFNDPCNPRDLNLCSIYDRILEFKFYKIRFGEKKPLLCINDPDIRILIDNERTEFFYIHKIIAYYVIFGQSDDDQLLNSHDIDKIYDYVEIIKNGEEKTGIIATITIENKPFFSHYTLAEYFAAQFLQDKLKSTDCRFVCTFLINSFLQSEKHGTIAFFDAMLENHQQLFNEIYNTDLTDRYNVLSFDPQKFSEVLFYIISNYFENVVIFLFRFVKGVLTKKNLNDFINVLTSYCYYNKCIMCHVVSCRAKKVFTFIIELFKSVDELRILGLFYCTNLDCSKLAFHDGLVYRLVRDLQDYGAFYLKTVSDVVRIFYEKIENPKSSISQRKRSLRKILPVLIQSFALDTIDMIKL